MMGSWEGSASGSITLAHGDKVAMLSTVSLYGAGPLQPGINVYSS